MDEEPTTTRDDKRIRRIGFFFFGVHRFKVWEVKANEEMML